MNATFINAVIGTVKKHAEEITWEDTRAHLAAIANEIMDATESTGAMPVASVPRAKWSEMYLAVDTGTDADRDITQAICEKHGLEPIRYDRMNRSYPTHYRAARQETYS